MNARDHPLYRRLPEAVADLAERCGARVQGSSVVRLSQTGRMRQAVSAPWMKFVARQTIAPDHCAFEWIARTGPFGLISVRDALVEGSGRLDVRACRVIPLAHVGPSPDLTRGEVMRYMAELAWAPDAILQNRDLRWRVDGPERLVVGAGRGDAAAEITLSLNRDGRIAEAFAPDRGALVEGVSVPKPWRGVFTDYRMQDETWLPFSGAVSWGGPSGEWVYWEGQIERWARVTLPVLERAGG